MRRLIALLSLIAVLAFSACGGTTRKTTVDISFPPAHEQGGRAYADAKSQNDAVRYCIAALTEWPQEYSAYDEVIFKIPGPGRDYTCARSK